MNYHKITKQYYTKWLGISSESFETRGIHFIYSKERNITQYGYSHPFDIYVWLQPGKLIVSYGDKASEKINELKQKMNATMSSAKVKELLSNTFGMPITQSIKYVYRETNATSCAVILSCSDYPSYLEFFRKAHLGCNNTDWLREYFDEMVQYGLCVGIFENSKLVSCSDAPGMPYMQETVQEIGVNTLPEYRGRGYASEVCIKCVKSIIKLGKCPIWSTEIDNAASQKLADKVGFVKFAETLTMTL